MRGWFASLISSLGILSSVGCTSTPLHAWSQMRNPLNVRGAPMSRVLESHFTPEAYERLKHIRVYNGYTLGDRCPAYAVGVNLWSRLAGLLTFQGPGDKVVVDYSDLGDDPFGHRTLYLLLHEYLHHAVHQGLVDREAFRAAFGRLRRDPSCEELVRALDADVFERSVFALWFGAREEDEYMATVGSAVMIQEKYDVPEYMENVFKDVLRLEHRIDWFRDAAISEK